MGVGVETGQAGTPATAQKNAGAIGAKKADAGTTPEAGRAGDQGGASKSATGAPEGPDPTGPTVPPSGPVGRRRIGVALGGGGALAMSEIGSLQWLEEHHIPVDLIAGTSMGGMVAALYATGKSIDDLKRVMNDQVFTSVFSIRTAYTSRSFRRREDNRELPNAVTIGLRHGVSFRNALLTDQGLNALLDREFLRYDDQTDFNTLPIPFRCLSTDLNDARTVTFARGSLPDAVRASVSIPGVYKPFEMKGHEFVDGAVLANLPVTTVREMQADVVIAVSLPLQPVAKGDLDSILGVLQRSFGVAIEANERASRRLADVVIEPDTTGFSESDYLKADESSIRGYLAAERQKAALLPYALDDAGWEAYLRQRNGRRRGPEGPVLQIRVKAPTNDVARNVQELFAPLVNQELDTARVESLLAEVRSDNRYEADYTIGYETEGTHRPIVQVTVEDKKTGPPFLLLGANVAAQTGGVSRATIEGVLLDQDLGGYGSELRTHIAMGYLTDVETEYLRRLPNVGGLRLSGPVRGGFVAPHVGLLRQSYPIYTGNVRVAERALQRAGGGVDVGWTDRSKQELRVGWEENDIRWRQQIGVADGLSDVVGRMQTARVRYAFSSQDKALIPQLGRRFTGEAGYLYKAAGGVNAPRITTEFGLTHTVGRQVYAVGVDGGTMLNRRVGEPYRFTIGGPLRLSASGLDQYRGTDYFLTRGAVLRKVASLPAVLGQSIFVGAVYEAGQMHAPDLRTVTRQDVFLGVVAETPLGALTFGPAVGDGGERKLVFTLGRLF